MRIVAVADTHCFEADLGALPDGDVFLHAGDLVRAGDLDELEGVAEWIKSLPHPHKVVIAGNHDFCFERSDERADAIALLGDGVIYLEDSEATIAGVRFWGSPWQPAFNDWAFNLPRGPALAERWAMIPTGIDVLVTHGPPHGIGDRSPVGGRTGCEELRTAVVRAHPLLHIFGHIHQDGGVFEQDGITFVNATTWECERGATVMDVDVASRRVATVVCPPREGRERR